MIARMPSNEKINPITTELLIRGRKLNLSFSFITLVYFAEPKNIRLNSPYYLILKPRNKQKLQQIAYHHSWDAKFEDFTNI